MSEENKSRSCEVVEYKENPDGSATVQFDFTEEEIQSFFRAGVLEALKRGIEQAASLDPNGPRRNTTFDLTWDQIDSIMTNELQDMHQRNLDDSRISDAVEVILEYIMPSSEFERWKQTTIKSD